MCLRDYMIKVAIVTDGPYGERAYENIKKEFETEFIELEQPQGMFVDDLEVPSNDLELIGQADIVITYVLHPDLTLELVEQLHDKVEWIIVGAWRGEGFKQQLIRFKNVTAPDNMCDLEENGNTSFDEFVSKFGQPIVRINCQGDKVVDIEVLRCSPCGATSFVADELAGQDTDNLPIKAGLKIQHFPCRAPKMRLFADDECKKELAANMHRDAFEKALNESKKD
jgi:hypothetical protein